LTRNFEVHLPVFPLRRHDCKTGQAELPLTGLHDDQLEKKRVAKQNAASPTIVLSFDVEKCHRHGQ
jgi:hypothetical protein